MELPAAARFDYLRDDANRRIRITARQPLLSEDLIAIVDRQIREEAWTFGVLYDLRAVYGATPRADVVKVAEHVRNCVTLHGARGPIALITRTVEMVAAGQMYAFLGAKAGVNVEVFWELAEGERWLDERQPHQS